MEGREINCDISSVVIVSTALMAGHLAPRIFIVANSSSPSSDKETWYGGTIKKPENEPDTINIPLHQSDLCLSDNDDDDFDDDDRGDDVTR